MKIKANKNIKHVVDFVNKMSPHACAVEAVEGIAAEALIAQAAAETGWGRSVLYVRMSDGSSRCSNNYFNIKDGKNWTGKIGIAMVPEYIKGQWVNMDEPFRVYENLTEALMDYVKLIRTVPRYETAWKVRSNACEYIKEIAKAGYATDPKYADIICSIINNLLLREG